MDAFTAIADLIVLICILLGVKQMAAVADLKTPRARLGLRIARIMTCSVGGVIVMVSLVLAVRKIDHFRNALYTQGTITGVQHSSHSLAPYSFYVEFQAAGRRRDEYAFTYLVFPKKERDKVTLIFDPKDRDKTEIVGFDAEWLGYSLIFGAGVLVILVSGWLYGWHN